MGTLHSGVILRLLEDMGIEEKTVIDDSDDHKKPVLLQIRGIIPVLGEGDLWPIQGFFIKVSDSTHAIYVSLSQEEDEMVLCNKLQLGQFIYVEKLEVAYPVPMLKGVRPIPGRQPCHGDPTVLDIVGTDIMEKLCGASKLLMQERKKKLIDRTPDVDKDRDSDSVTFVSQSRRRSWCGIEKTSWEIPQSSVVKHEITPVRHWPSSYVSAVCSSRHDNSNTRTRTKDISQSPKPVKTPNRIRKTSSARNSMEPLSEEGPCASSNNKRCAETEMLWDSLPSSLVKIGKEVLRQRDAALLAAVEAVQEAAATERLLRCLSTFSELRLAKAGDQQPSINKFFKLQDNLAQCRVIVDQLLTNISPLRTTADSDLNTHGSIRETSAKLAMNRKRNAAAWIKAAVASDLIPLSACRTKNEGKGTNKPSQVTKMKGTYTIRKQTNNGEFHSALAAEKENIPDWVKGSTLSAAENLARSLQEECKTWFLAYAENYLDGFSNKCLFSKLHDSQVAESMCEMKRLNDWLDMVEKEEGCSDNSTLGSFECEAFGRVRKKIYGVLLKHVERTAMVLDNNNINEYCNC